MSFSLERRSLSVLTDRWAHAAEPSFTIELAFQTSWRAASVQRDGRYLFVQQHNFSWRRRATQRFGSSGPTLLFFSDSPPKLQLSSWRFAVPAATGRDATIRAYCSRVRVGWFLSLLVRNPRLAGWIFLGVRFVHGDVLALLWHWEVVIHVTPFQPVQSIIDLFSAWCPVDLTKSPSICGSARLFLNPQNWPALSSLYSVLQLIFQDIKVRFVW